MHALLVGFALLVQPPADSFREARDAVERLQTDRLERLLRAEPSLARRTDAFGFTLLHRVRRPEEARLLLSRGAPLEARNRYGATPLLEACRRNLPAVARLLLARRADPLARMDNGSTALHLAADSAGPEVARLLLDARAPVDAVDRQGRTPLHRAAQAGNAPVLGILLRAGANPTLEDADGRTPLAIAEQRRECCGTSGGLAESNERVIALLREALAARKGRN
ncbi:MAG: ankyrin repeat domain-containing protein [Fimbriimonadales bacterium]|nr:ankyrin repeat domain-containing protein [Fimbriimonadales bacterium]